MSCTSRLCLFKLRPVHALSSHTFWTWIQGLRSMYRRCPAVLSPLWPWPWRERGWVGGEKPNSTLGTQHPHTHRNTSIKAVWCQTSPHTTALVKNAIKIHLVIERENVLIFNLNHSYVIRPIHFRFTESSSFYKSRFTYAHNLPCITTVSPCLFSGCRFIQYQILGFGLIQNPLSEIWPNPKPNTES